MSPNSSKATLPVTPSNETLAIASMVAWRAASAESALASEVFSALMMALAASYEYAPYASYGSAYPAAS